MVSLRCLLPFALLLPQQVLGASIEDAGGDALSPALWDLHSIAGTACTRSHLEALWEELQTIGTYYFVDGMSHAEIARITGVSRRTIGNRLAKLQEMAEQAAGREEH